MVPLPHHLAVDAVLLLPHHHQPAEADVLLPHHRKFAIYYCQKITTFEYNDISSEVDSLLRSEINYLVSIHLSLETSRSLSLKVSTEDNGIQIQF